MRGDALASGERSAVFTGPRLKFSEGQMRDDLKKLNMISFIDKYMITAREYTMLREGTDEKISSFAEDMKHRAQKIEQELARDEAQETSLQRDCFLEPFVPIGITGRVIVTRDAPAKKQSALALPKSMRKERTLLPTTGHIIKAHVIDDSGTNVSAQFISKRVLFGQMSGTAICFKRYPTWIQLELSEIMAWVLKEDMEIVEEELEPMV